VVFVILVSEESHTTFVALENLENLMTLFMNMLVTFCDKSLWTIIALEILLTCMNFFVVNQAILKLELLATDLVRTLVA
jgi:hypothetical protein